MRDPLGKRALKRVVLFFTWTELQFRRLLVRTRGQPKYKLLGTCNGCGRCCESPTLQAGLFTWRFPRFRKFVLWWQREVNGFELKEIDKRFKLFVFRCTHYDPVKKTCDSYDSRPLMCRDYPRNLLFEALPELFPECSHSVVLKKADAFRAALAKTNLSPEARVELEEKLKLRAKSDPGSDQK